MPINEKLLSFAVDNAFKKVNESLPALSQIINQYVNWKHEDLKKAFTVINDIENIIITKNKENKIMGIDLRVIPVYLKVQLINADINEQEYKKFAKLLNDLKELLK